MYPYSSKAKPWRAVGSFELLHIDSEELKKELDEKTKVDPRIEQATLMLLVKATRSRRHWMRQRFTNKILSREIVEIVRLRLEGLRAIASKPAYKRVVSSKGTDRCGTVT